MELYVLIPIHIYLQPVGTSAIWESCTLYVSRPEHVIKLREGHHVLQVEALREAHLTAQVMGKVQ